MAKRVCVVGAGIAGLATAKVLREDDFDVVVFEKEATSGGVWAAPRTYPGLRANNPRETYAFSDHPYPQGVDEYPTAEQIRAYLDSYVARFKLSTVIRLGVEVVLIRRATAEADASPGYDVTIRTVAAPASTETLRFDLVVVCNGVFSLPHVPDFEGRALFRGRTAHSSEMRDLNIAPGQRLVVVGAGKSAFDCATSTATLGALTYLVFREPHWLVPRFFFGLIRSDYLFMTRFAEAFLKYHRMSPTEAFLHGPAKLIVSMWWRLNNAMIRQLLRMPAEFEPSDPLPLGFENLGVGAEFFDVLRQGKIRPRRASIARFNERGIELDSGERIDADIVIFATGWRQGLPFLSPELADTVEHDGRFRLYRFILPPRERNLGFIGYASSNACQFSAEIAAHWLSQSFRGEMGLPGATAMEDEIARVQQWMDEVVPRRNQGYFIGPYIGHYTDELLRDMGLVTRRRQSGIAELMAPFRPHLYATLGTERRKLRQSA